MTNEMKKVQTAMYVFTGRPYGIAYDIEDLNGILTELANDKGDNAMKEAHIYNVTQESPVNVFPLTYIEGELELGDICYSRSNDGTFRVDDYDKEFTDEDDLKAWLQEQVKHGELDLDEVQGLSITYVEEAPGYYEEAEQEKGEWRMDVSNFEEKHRVAMDAMACEYVDASEAEKVINELTKPLFDETKPMPVIPAPVEEMTDEELNAELFEMLDRVNAIQQEKRRRESL